jgi:hypothetical protein
MTGKPSPSRPLPLTAEDSSQRLFSLGSEGFGGGDEAVAIGVIAIEFAELGFRPGCRVLGHRDLPIGIAVVAGEPGWEAFGEALRGSEGARGPATGGISAGP